MSHQDRVIVQRPERMIGTPPCSDNGTDGGLCQHREMCATQALDCGLFRLYAKGAAWRKPEHDKERGARLKPA